MAKNLADGADEAYSVPSCFCWCQIPKRELRSAAPAMVGWADCAAEVTDLIGPGRLPFIRPVAALGWNLPWLRESSSEPN